EGDGRELLAAMAAGVPALCPRSSIYAEYIDHGVDGLLYDAPEDALQQLTDLRDAPARAVALGRAARAKVSWLVAPEHAASALGRLVVGRHVPLEPVCA